MPAYGCHLDRSTPWSVEHFHQWYGTGPREKHFGETFAAAREGFPGLAADLIRVAKAPRQPAIVRATAVSLLDNTPGRSAAEALGDLVEDPSPPGAGGRLWMLWDRCRPKSGSPGWGRPCRTRCVWCAPWPAGFWPGLPRRGFHPGNASSGPRPSASMKRSSGSMPTIPPGRLNLGNLYREQREATTGLKSPTGKQWSWSRPSSPPI